MQEGLGLWVHELQQIPPTLQRKWRIGRLQSVSEESLARLEHQKLHLALQGHNTIIGFPKEKKRKKKSPKDC